MKQSTVPPVLDGLQSWQSPPSLTGSPTQSTNHPMNIAMGSAPVPSSVANPLPPEALAVFEEATQMVSRFLNIPICVMGWADGEVLKFQSAVGLSHLGFMNPLARNRQISLTDPLLGLVWQKSKPIALSDTSTDAGVAASILVQTYGVKAYLGVPLITTQGQCLGLLMAMDTASQVFSEAAIAYVEMAARWSVSEYERYTQPFPTPAPTAPASDSPLATPSLDMVRLNLIGQLTEELRNPLTSITGMAGMLSREIYGPLTPKQQEYTEIVRQSSQQLREMVDEIIDLSALHYSETTLAGTSVDVDMLGQQVLSSLAALAKHHNKTLALTISPGSRLWTLDKTVFKQVLYHLVFCVINGPGEGGTVKIHASRQNQTLKLAVWLSHPWLGEGLPSAVSTLAPHLAESVHEQENGDRPLSREVLALLLSRHLAEAHGGTLTLQGNEESGYRLVAVLPALADPSVSEMAV
ncbi:MAG: histidine kinase dimerization/phospho-acceptor domain-containing protein [Leptolyngbyaceae cyanobacterium]